MSEVMANAQLYEEMSLAARKTAEDQFDVRLSARRILEYLSKVIEHTKGND